MSMMNVQAVFTFTPDNRSATEAARRKFAVYEGDHLTMLNVYNSFIKAGKSSDWCSHNHVNYRSLMRAVDIRNQIKKYLRRFKVPLVSCEEESEKILKCLVSGYFANAAKLTPDGSYKMIRGGQVNIRIFLINET